MTRRPLGITGGVVALLVVAAGALHYRARITKSSATGTIVNIPSREKPKDPSGEHITVEVLNATKIRGLARRATIVLRDRGFDVVSTGTNPDQFDSTRVLDRTGHREWAARAAKAMGGGTVLVRPDSSRDVDLTVLIGASWHPPTQPFYP